MTASPLDSAKKTNPYLIGDEPRLLDSFVCYVDLLGWKAASLQAFASGAAESFITQTRQQIHVTYEHLRHLQQITHRSTRSFEVKTFTDNIVLALPIDTEFVEGELISLLEMAALLQLELLSIGFPTRGGVAYGPHFMDDDFAFGQALIEAVQFDKTGMLPRVVLAPNVASLVEAEAGGSRFPYVVKDTDGQFILSYLGVLFEGYPDFPINFDTLQTHSELIRAGLSHKDAHVRSKYQWLAHYQNFAIQDRQRRSFAADDEDMAAAISLDLEQLTTYCIPISAPARTFLPIFGDPPKR